MDDVIIEHIQSGVLNPNNISFDVIRNYASKDYDIWEQLGRGRSTLANIEQLNQYLYSYGGMIRDQWSVFLADFELTPEPTQIIDYGCGQGLGTILLFDHFGNRLIDSVKRVILIEPSKVALRRAKAVISCYSDDIEVIPINKRLEDLTPEELSKKDDAMCIQHVFSNVLDLDNFDHIELFSKILQTKGGHVVLSVSHDRFFCGGTGRIQELKNEIDSVEHKEYLKVTESPLYKLKSLKASVGFFTSLEVLDGPF